MAAAKRELKMMIFNFFAESIKKRAQDGKFKIGLRSQETIHHESSFYIKIQLNLIELRARSLQDGNQTINVQLRRF